MLHRVCCAAQNDPRDESRRLRLWSSKRFAPQRWLKFAISDNEHLTIIRVFGGGFGFLHSLRVLMTPGCPHALHPHYSPPSLPPNHSPAGGVCPLWTDGWEVVRAITVMALGRKWEEYGSKREIESRIFRRHYFPSITAVTHCLQQHMVPVVKTELDARHQPPPRTHHPTTNGAPAPNSLN